MDDEFDLGSSVWTTSIPSTSSSSKLNKSYPKITSTTSSLSQPEDEFDDDDGFDEPITVPASAEDDDFGDFGDFGDFRDPVESIDSTGFTQPLEFSADEDFHSQSSTEWNALHLYPQPSHSTLREEVDVLLHPLWLRSDASQFLTQENIRQVEGLNQILVTSEARSLYNTLFQSAQLTPQPPNWTRSRIRRRHLVSLGIPVNLDEVLPHANGKALPALQITTRPVSAPPGPRGIGRVASPSPASASNSRPSTPKPSALARASSATQTGLGPKPEIDEAKIDQVLALSSDSLALLPLPTLDAHLAQIRSLTANTSALLTHLLQQCDALQQDSETYNGLIAELVGEAQKIKSGPKARTSVSRRSSGFS